MNATHTKRLAFLLAVLLCLSCLIGCGGKYIGKAKAKEIALADAGITSKDIRDYSCELDKEPGRATVYEVDFEVGFNEYEYDIDATTGEILKSKIDD